MSEPGAPPPPPYYTPPPPPPTGAPAVRIADWFNEAWNLVKAYWLEYVLAILVSQLVIAGASFLCFLPVLVVIGPIMGGVQIYLAKRLLGIPAQVGDVFKGFRRFKDTAILGLVIFMLPLVFILILSLPTVLGSLGASSSGRAGEMIAEITGCLGCMTIPLGILFAVVYPILVGTFLVFAMPLVMFRQMEAIAAIRRSIELVKPQFTNFLLLLLANFVLLAAAQFVGGLLLCIGALILSPLAMSIVYTMQLLAYRDFVGLSPDDLAPYAD